MNKLKTSEQNMLVQLDKTHLFRVQFKKACLNILMLLLQVKYLMKCLFLETKKLLSHLFLQCTIIILKSSPLFFKHGPDWS